MWEVLKGEFFWGLVVGLFLSFVAGWVLAHFTARLAQRQQKQVVKSFCIDLIQNLKDIIDELDQNRDRTRAIFHDILALIEAEVVVYGRNREHLIHLPPELRVRVRKFMNVCGLKRAETASKLDDFYQLERHSNDVAATGRAPEAQRLKEAASLELSEAHKAVDRLVAVSKDAGQLIADLKDL